MSYSSNSAMNAYRKTGASTQVAEASPHRLVQLMLESAVDRLAAARGHIERGHVAEKGEALSRVLALVDTLNASLDMEKGGAVASNLSLLDAEFLNHRVAWTEGVCADDAAQMMRDFFRRRRM